MFRDVIIQQVVQTAFGLAMAAVDEAPVTGMEEFDVAVWAKRVRMAQGWLPMLLRVVGLDARALAGKLGKEHAMFASALAGGKYSDLTQTILMDGQPTTAPAFATWEMLAAKIIYHVFIPALQFIMAVCVVDTWQYFLHRAMHMNKYLYTAFHSRHHRLYVPYAYGALYNHPVEGFLLDTLGTGVAYLVTGMTVRQSMWFFTCCTIKTVDDHGGYSFPWDPLQRLTSNNAGYHDVHHQSWGIKTNFSQPFFTFWDEWLGTKWTGGDVSARYERAKAAAQKKVDASAKHERAASITASAPSESVTAASDKPYEHDFETATSTARTASAIAEPAIPSPQSLETGLGQPAADPGRWRAARRRDRRAGGGVCRGDQSAEGLCCRGGKAESEEADDEFGT